MVACLLILGQTLTYTAITHASDHYPPNEHTTSSKAGLGWGGGGEISQFDTGKVAWYYTWTPTSWVQPPPNFEFVPMLWGGKDVDAFSQGVNSDSIASNGWTHVLGMNEPQEPSQSNLSPQDAANMWKTYIEPLRAANPNIRLGSPAPSSRPNGIQWIWDFLGNCNGGCTVDFIALHYYDINATGFIQHINEYRSAFQRPIWVTEWACQNFNNGPQCSYNQIVKFLNETQTYMDNTDWVERYAWFGAMANTPINKMWNAKSNLVWAASLLLFLCQSGLGDGAVLHDISGRQSTSLKAGLGWGGGGNISQFEGHQVGWYFTWSPASWVAPPPALEYVPQLWGGRDAALFASVINSTSTTSNGIKNVLGMNEPQEPTQSNLSPQDGATMWKTYLEPLRAAGVRLGSPATTSAPNGKTWIQEFLTACAGGCSVDFIALHWYGNVAAEFISYIEDFYNTFQRPIWVTEWACLNFAGGVQCTYDEIVQFMDTTQTYMDQAGWVERYAWFGAMANLPAGVNNFTALMDPSGVINPLGQQYIGPPAGSTPPSASSVISTTTIFATGTTTTTTLTSAHDTTPAGSSSAPASTTSAYVTIGRAPANFHLNYLAILFGIFLAYGSSIL